MGGIETSFSKQALRSCVVAEGGGLNPFKNNRHTLINHSFNLITMTMQIIHRQDNLTQRRLQDDRCISPPTYNDSVSAFTLNITYDRA
jgi:hypothetical protein